MKLVRDLIPRIIEESGSSCIYHVVKGEELKKRLYDKMTEELNEFIDDFNSEFNKMLISGDIVQLNSKYGLSFVARE